MDLSGLGKQVSTQAINYLVKGFIAMKKHMVTWPCELWNCNVSWHGMKGIDPHLWLWHYPALFVIGAVEVEEMCGLDSALRTSWLNLLPYIQECFSFCAMWLPLSIQTVVPKELWQWFCPPTPNCCWNMKCSASKHDLLTTNWAFLFVFPVLSLILLQKAAAGVKTQQLLHLVTVGGKGYVKLQSQVQ